MANTIKSDIVNIDDVIDIQNITEINNNNLTNKQLELLNTYEDKSLLMSLLCERSSEKLSFFKSLVNVPLILSSAVLAILNSSNFDSEKMKVPNIIINSLTTVILAMVGNFKLNEKETNFKGIGTKMLKLNHKIVDLKANNINNIDSNDIKNIGKEYDSLIDQIDFNFPNDIKKKIANNYIGKKKLPNVLVCLDDKLP